MRTDTKRVLTRAILFLGASWAVAVTVLFGVYFAIRAVLAHWH